MRLASPSFEHKGGIPSTFTCDGKDANPQLRIEGVPEDAKSLALIVDDPDAPGGTWTHWTAWNIDPKTTMIKEDSLPPGLPAAAGAKTGATEGTTSFGKPGYGGPCPPPGNPHRYFFTLYALDAVLSLPPGSARAELENEIHAHLLASAEFMGLYGR